MPFTITMAGRHVYEVLHRDYISLSTREAVVVVYDDQDHLWVLPLLTMTGRGYKDMDSEKKPA